MRRALIPTLLLMPLAACRSTELEWSEAYIYVGDGTAPVTSRNWVSCTDRGCRFSARGWNEGPQCTNGVEGYIRLLDADRRVLLSAPGVAAVFAWHVEPDRGATIPVGGEFVYETDARLPPETMVRSAFFNSAVMAAGVHRC